MLGAALKKLPARSQLIYADRGGTDSGRNAVKMLGLSARRGVCISLYACVGVPENVIGDCRYRLYQDLVVLVNVEICSQILLRSPSKWL